LFLTPIRLFCSFPQGKCHICRRVFCCGKCRQKHQFNAHAIAVRESLERPRSLSQPGSLLTEHRLEVEPGVTSIYVFCPICERRPLLLREEMHGELLAHIEACHLPLRCRKCQRNYTRIDDLREFSKCADQREDCSGMSGDLSCETEASKVTVKRAPDMRFQATAMSTQTSPSMLVTPNMRLINMRWKAKRSITHEEFIGDSVSSIRNLSSISNSSIRRPQSLHPADTVEKGKVIRSTSTPLQVENIFAKPKEPVTFNATNGGHVSSIYQEEASPAPDPNPPLQLQQRAWKMSTRSKMSAVTPLRQVMSKSIQKAFVEHGGIGMQQQQQQPSRVMQRRMRLDLSDNGNNSIEQAGSGGAAGAALDLRLSPAMRRTQSESSAQSASSVSSYKQQITTESIIITSSTSSSASSATVYNTCESVEIISAAVHLPTITPVRLPASGGGMNKKLINFETPPKSDDPAKGEGEGGDSDGVHEETKDDAFFTPNPGTLERPERPERRNRHAIVPRQLSEEFGKDQQQHAGKKASPPPPEKPKPRPPLRECRQAKAFSGVQDLPGRSASEENTEPESEAYGDEEEVFLPTNASTRNDRKQQGASGGLWSLMSSMIRLPASLRGDGHKPKDACSAPPSGSLIRRCASIAGSLVRPARGDGAGNEDGQSLKRKRTQTLDNQYCSPLSPSVNSSKRYRIRPREPIERMRNT
ncbi:hypothetical protein KR018_002225, partial [Drosophila ironensis]